MLGWHSAHGFPRLSDSLLPWVGQTRIMVRCFVAFIAALLAIGPEAGHLAPDVGYSTETSLYDPSPFTIAVRAEDKTAGRYWEKSPPPTVTFGGAALRPDFSQQTHVRFLDQECDVDHRPRRAARVSPRAPPFLA